MSSEYFTYSDMARGQLAKAADVNSRFRGVEAGLDKLPASAKLHQDRIGYHVAGGTANAIAVAMLPALTAYTEGLKLRLKIAATNSGAVTLNCNGLGAIAVKRHNGDAVAAGDLVAGQVVEVTYDGAAFVMLRISDLALAAHVTAAQTHATNSANSATSSANSATTAAGHVTTALGHANTAGTHKDAAAASASLAQSWATSLVVVADGLFGARKYAQDAKAHADSVDPANLLTKTGNLAGLASTPTARENLALKGNIDLADIAALATTGAGGRALKRNAGNTGFEFAEAGISSANIQDFTASGTWTKPAGAKSVEVVMWGGGGGGGGGILGANFSGGAGGSGASYARASFEASEIAASIAVTVGSAGSGGAASTSSGAAGGAGGAGGTTSFGSLLARGGVGGASGSSTAVDGGIGLFPGGFGAGALGFGGNVRVSGATTAFAPCGGGGGGGNSTTDNTSGTGGIGSLRGPAATTGGGGAGATVGGAGSAGAARVGAIPGTAGGGGGGNGGGAAGAGGAGGSGAGGGGGGAGSSVAGAGGAGGAGFCRVITYF